jgi:ribosome-binding factor A
MSYNRIDRISEEVRREVDRIIREDLSDPRIAGTFSVTHADVTRDLRHAKIYVSVLEDDKREGVMAALKKAAGFIRRELGRNIIIRYSPELTFVSDQNIAYGVHIAKVLADAQKTEGVTHEEDESPAT